LEISKSKKITLNNVRFYMRKNSIKLLRKTRKHDLVGLIAKAKLEYDAAADKLLPKNAGTKPAFITCDITLTRIIACYFDSSIRSAMQSVGNSVTKDELDSRDFKFKAYSKLLELYNDPAKLVEHPLEDCDAIDTAKSTEAVMKFINYHYKHAYDKWDRSGSHDNFGNFVGNKAYLVEYWKLLHDTDDAVLNSYATAELPSEVFHSSLETCEKRSSNTVKEKVQTKKTKIALDERRVEAIEGLAKSMNLFYTKDANDKESFVSVFEEKTVYFQNKLIEAYEKKENLTNRMAKDILDDQISFYKKKIEELREN